MRIALARPLLLILLLVLAGQAPAAPCASGIGGDTMPMSADGDHCPAGAGGDYGQHGGACTEPSSDCEQNCNCCPGHCTSLLLANDGSAAHFPGHSPATPYREFDTSPDPETALRPPILR